MEQTGSLKSKAGASCERPSKESLTLILCNKDLLASDSEESSCDYYSSSSTFSSSSSSDSLSEDNMDTGNAERQKGSLEVRANVSKSQTTY